MSDRLFTSGTRLDIHLYCKTVQTTSPMTKPPQPTPQRSFGIPLKPPLSSRYRIHYSPAPTSPSSRCLLVPLHTGCD